MERAIRLINRLSIGLGLLVAPLTAIITALVFYEVICRYFLNAATSWTAEVENYLQVTLVMLGGAYCLSHGSHVRVDVLYQAFSNSKKALVDILTGLIVLLVTGPMIWFGGHLAWEAWVTKQTSSSAAEIVLWPSMATVPVGAGLLALQALALAASAVIYLLKEKKSGES
ncbi:MAG: hypothetical protein COX16_15805 [Deltaproteobacteria bacterium CG23_combo_of_CG06-09_8_20_14_all_51_20]|nr:TRAP transporter small permease subunit [bacterium]OIP39561.1 MAG: hypothetical protein AUK25_10005 [Desulfobacteraceae bacterium CG2_30_51_40]PIP44945.1 MAG: hypothetical protein COX16_15805 [Deltaproteobacteria bacterium CG23_combo_of_CG06-09_8_20_14_all_51_20]PIY22651.1 MAG: hypothetical protein COZ11_11855 [Deltaproteobacteria bacterium CG_4_10_14_3_um_filter_51_14]PJB37294.1 MAG: hypothetical protein CO107_05245 [Deltaproteobacteria bacterium CG_4_9_14_3_um_filter_51_14]